MHEALNYTNCCKPTFHKGGTKLAKGPVLTAKIGLASSVLAAKLARGTSFGKFFCQKQSNWTDFKGTNVGVTESCSISQ